MMKINTICLAKKMFKTMDTFYVNNNNNNHYHHSSYLFRLGGAIYMNGFLDRKKENKNKELYYRNFLISQKKNDRKNTCCMIPPNFQHLNYKYPFRYNYKILVEEEIGVY